MHSLSISTQHSKDPLVLADSVIVAVFPVTVTEPSSVTVIGVVVARVI